MCVSIYRRAYYTIPGMYEAWNTSFLYIYLKTWVTVLRGDSVLRTRSWRVNLAVKMHDL